MRQQDHRRVVSHLCERRVEIVDADPANAAKAPCRQISELIAEPGEPEGMAAPGQARDIILVDGNADGFQRVLRNGLALPFALHGAVIPIIMIAEDRMHAERRLQLRQGRRPFGGRYLPHHVAMPGHVVAEHDDDIGMKRVGAFDDRLNVPKRHPGIAGMKVGDDGDLELEARRPLRWRNVVTGNVKPQQRLDAEAIGRGRGAEGTEAGEEAKEFTACNHGSERW